MAPQTFEDLAGIDYTLPTSPPLVDPPLSLLDLSRTLIDTRDLVEQARQANERVASAQSVVDDIPSQGDRPGEADDVEDAGATLEQMQAEWDARSQEIDAARQALRAAEAFASEQADQVAALSRWEMGFQYLPELSNEAGVETVAPYGTTPKRIGSNQTPFAWYDPFTIVGRDARSAFGWPNTDFLSRVGRARRALQAHDSWQVEQEFWAGIQIPTNYHLSASPSTPLVYPGRRQISAFPNPDPAPGTVLGTPVPIGVSLAALDQALASSDAGTGMIHATPYMVQLWMKIFNYIRDSDGKVYTVNHNLIVPGYGYPGTGPDAASRSVADGVTILNSPEVTSATAAFTAADLGRPVSGTNIPAGAVVGVVTSGTEIMLYGQDPDTGAYGVVNSLAAGTGQPLTVSGQGGNATFAPQQWCYATEQTFECLSDLYVYPSDINQQAPLLTVDNSMDVRVEQQVAIITNRLCRTAALVDTTTS